MNVRKNEIAEGNLSLSWLYLGNKMEESRSALTTTNRAWIKEADAINKRMRETLLSLKMYTHSELLSVREEFSFGKATE